MLRFTSTTQSFCEVHRALCSIHFLRCACRCPSFLSLSHLFTRFLMEIGKITLPEVRMKKPAINHWWAKCNYRSSACESFRWYNSRYWLTISTMKPLIHIQLSQLIFQEFAYILCTGLSQERAVAQKPKTFRIATYAQKLFGRSFTFCCSFSSLNLSMPSTQFIIWHFLTSQINLHLFILFSGSIDHQGWVMFKLTPEFNHACLPPPLPLVLLSASLNCFNLAQSAVGYGQWHRLSSILFVLASLKIQKHTCWLEKKSILPRFLTEYCLKNGWACRGDHFTTIHIRSLFRFMAVLSFLA